MVLGEIGPGMRESQSMPRGTTDPPSKQAAMFEPAAIITIIFPPETANFFSFCLCLVVFTFDHAMVSRIVFFVFTISPRSEFFFTWVFLRNRMTFFSMQTYKSLITNQLGISASLATGTVKFSFQLLPRYRCCVHGSVHKKLIRTYSLLLLCMQSSFL